MKPLDHKNLDKDVEYFADVVRWVLGTNRGTEAPAESGLCQLTDGRCRVCWHLFQPWYFSKYNFI